MRLCNHISSLISFKWKNSWNHNAIYVCLLLSTPPPPFQFQIWSRWPLFMKSDMNTMSLEATTNFLQTVVTTGWINILVGLKYEMMCSNRSSKLCNFFIEYNNMTPVWNPNLSLNLMLINKETELLMFIRQQLKIWCRTLWACPRNFIIFCMQTQYVFE